MNTNIFGLTNRGKVQKDKYFDWYLQIQIRIFLTHRETHAF